MIVEYNIEKGVIWTSFPHYTLTIRDDGDVVDVVCLDKSASYTLNVERCSSDAERLLFALADLCESQALTTAPRAA